MTTATLRITNSLLAALIGTLGRVGRETSYDVAEDGALELRTVGDQFVPLRGERLDVFIERVLAGVALHDGDKIEATASNGVLTSITVQHDDRRRETTLDVTQCQQARAALLFLLAHGYGTLALQVAGQRLRLRSQDITLRPAGTLDAFIEQVRSAGLWCSGDVVTFSSNKQGGMGTVRITRR